MANEPSPLPEIKSIRRQIDAVSHLELKPFKAGQSIQSLGVTVFVHQWFKSTRYFLFFSFFSPSTAATEPKLKAEHINNKVKKMKSAHPIQIRVWMVLT